MAPNTQPASRTNGDGKNEMDSCSLNNSPTVIVIGSGFAGLAAARTLREASFNVIVLESRDRIGGRTHTNYSFGFPLDLGAAWLHGVSAENPLARVIGTLKLPMYRTSEDDSVLYDHDLESFFLYEKNGDKISSDLVSRIGKHFEDLLEETKLLRKEFKGDVSMKQALLTVYNRRPELKLNGVEERILQWYICRMEGWFATDFDKLSSLHWDEENLLKGGHGLLINGYFPALQYLAKGLDIKFNHRVNKIEWNSHGVRIHTENNQLFSADAAVITIPVGVLKTKSVEFLPPLPLWKQKTISGMGFGCENKIALKYEEAFWPNVEFLGVVAETSYECSYFLNVHKATGNPVLVFMPAGKLAHDIERLTDDETIEFVMRQLRHIIPCAPNPSNYMITRWGSDPNALGSYSYEIARGPSNPFENLFKPVETLFFAGEACSKEYQGTVHGAYDTGVNAAKRIRNKFFFSPKYAELELFSPTRATEERSIIPVTFRISRL